MKKNRGITLISLVLTVIILLILAGITINLTLTNGSLIDHTYNAKQKNENSMIEENKVLDEAVNWIDQTIGGQIQNHELYVFEEVDNENGWEKYLQGSSANCNVSFLPKGIQLETFNGAYWGHSATMKKVRDFSSYHKIYAQYEVRHGGYHSEAFAGTKIKVSILDESDHILKEEILDVRNLPEENRTIEIDISDIPQGKVKINTGAIINVIFTRIWME